MYYKTPCKGMNPTAQGSTQGKTVVKANAPCKGKIIKQEYIALQWQQMRMVQILPLTNYS